MGSERASMPCMGLPGNAEAPLATRLQVVYKFVKFTVCKAWEFLCTKHSQDVHKSCKKCCVSKIVQVQYVILCYYEVLLLQFSILTYFIKTS